MSWLGFLPRPSAARPSPASASASSSSAAPATSTSSAAASEEEEWSDEKPQVRILTQKEMEKLQAENEQLRDILKQLTAAAKAEGAAYPSFNSDTAASSPAPPSSFVFHRVPNISSSSRSSSSSSAAMPTPSAPAADTTAQPEGDFYSALRQSLAKEAQQQSSAAATKTTTAEDEEETDDWDAPSAVSTSAPVSDSLQAPRTADEAIVHSKNASIIVRKKPLRPKLDDEEGSSSSAAAAPASTATAGDDEFDDFAEFGPEATAGIAAAGANAALAATAEDEGEEIAIISDLSAADWWHVVPHPDRPGETLEAPVDTPPDPQEDSDGFVVVRGQDSLMALGEFLSSLMAKHPEIRRLSPEQLRALIDQSLTDAGVKEPTTLGKAWQWGKQAYTVWSYGAWGLSLYRNETFVRIVAAGIIKAATWTAIFFI